MSVLDEAMESTRKYIKDNPKVANAFCSVDGQDFLFGRPIEYVDMPELKDTHIEFKELPDTVLRVRNKETGEIIYLHLSQADEKERI